MFDKCVHVLFNLHASMPVWAGCVSSLYYIIQNIFLCSIIQNVYTFANKKYIHTYNDQCGNPPVYWSYRKSYRKLFYLVENLLIMDLTGSYCVHILINVLMERSLVY